MQWKDIESAPKDGGDVLPFWPDGRTTIGHWTTNARLTKAGDANMEALGIPSPSYFTDHDEWDDYECARPESQPAHWMPLPPPPTERAG